MFNEMDIYGLDNCMNNLKSGFPIIEGYPNFPDPTKFETFKRYEHIILKRGARIQNTNTYGIFVEVEYRLPPSKSGPQTAIEDHFYAFSFLGQDFGHILLRRETLQDKINELFSNVEIDFSNDKEFSKKFYVLASDKKKVGRFLKDSVRRVFIDYSNENTEAEVLNQWLIVGDKRGLQAKLVFDCLSLGWKIEIEIQGHL